MFGLCIITAVSLVGAIWFQSFQRDIFALLNPEEAMEEKFFASVEQKTIFENLGEAFKDLGALFGGFLGSREMSEDDLGQGIEKTPEDRVYLLPLSEQRE